MLLVSYIIYKKQLWMDVEIKWKFEDEKNEKDLKKREIEVIDEFDNDFKIKKKK